MAKRTLKAADRYFGEAELVTGSGESSRGVVDLQKGGNARGVPPWDGTMRPRGAEILPLDPGQYTLRLPDGSEAPVLIRRATLRSGPQGVSQEFELVGAGPAPF